MRWLDAITRLLHAVAWPGVALVALLMFRNPLGRAIDRVRKLSLGDRVLELTVDDVLALPAGVRGATVDARDQDADRELLALAAERPDKAVHSAYVRLISALWEVVPEADSLGQNPNDLERCLGALVADGRLEPAALVSGAALERIARSVWAAEGTLAPATAADLVRSANALRARLHNMRPGAHLD